MAIALGSHGCTVYITGRSQTTGQTENLPGTIYETADAVTAAGGKGIAVVCDHADDAQTKAVFDQVEREQGRMDILVNNAAKVSDVLTDPGGFWEKPLDLVDLLDVGLRSAYVCSYYAVPMMVRQKHGLMIFTGSQGGVCYFMGPAYGAHKAGEDKFAADMGYELKDHGVAAICIWCGGVLTDRLKRILDSDPGAYAGVEEMCETPEFTGHVIWRSTTTRNSWRRPANRGSAPSWRLSTESRTRATASRRACAKCWASRRASNLGQRHEAERPH